MDMTEDYCIVGMFVSVVSDRLCDIYHRQCIIQFINFLQISVHLLDSFHFFDFFVFSFPHSYLPLCST